MPHRTETSSASAPRRRRLLAALVGLATALSGAVSTAGPPTEFASSDGSHWAVIGGVTIDESWGAETPDKLLESIGLELPHPTLELVRLGERTARDGELTVLHFGATRDGRRVLGYSLRLVVAQPHREVVLASVRDGESVATFQPAEVPAAQALARARRSRPELERWSEAIPVWFRRGDELVAGWQFFGHGRVDDYVTTEWLVDAVSGHVEHTRSAIRDFVVTGDITGRATPGLLPDVPYNPAVPIPLRNVTVRAGSVSTTTAADGSYTLDVPGTSANVSASLEGPWVNVIDFFSGSTWTIAGSTTAPGTLDLEFGPGSDPDTVGAVNCFVHVDAAHDFIATRNPSITSIDLPVTCEVGVPFPCVAGFDPFLGSLIFSTVGGAFPGGSCTGLAMSTIIVHEYGHFVHLGLGIDDQAFGEGYGDALSALVFDDPISGQDVFGPGVPGRDVSFPDVQYPCSSPDPHECGLLLAGVWWDVKEALQVTLGPVAGLETARQLFVDWTAITAGGPSAAHPGTAIEVLTVDDDNADLADGTPHYAEICAAFALHGIDCPPITATPSTPFRRGDCNRDGVIDVSDPVFDLAVQFIGETPECDDACDVNDDGANDISDPVHLLTHLFAAGPAPAAPFPRCGDDPTVDGLECQATTACP